MKKTIFILLLITFTNVYSQILWNGIYTFEIKKGGDDSSELINELPNENFNIFPGKLQLFLDTEIEADKIYFSSKIEANTIKNIKLSPLRIYQISIIFVNLFDRDINVEAGRILTPFGKFKELQHNPDNPFISFPLSHVYYMNVSRKRGFFNPAKWEPDPGLEIAYHGTYYSGVKAFGSFFDRQFQYDLAITNGPLSNYGTDLELNNEPGFIGRVAFEPKPWLNLGASFSTGAFIEEDPVNENFDIDKYKQTAFGGDLRINYMYYDFIFEYIYNTWKAPVISQDNSRLLADEVDLNVNSLFASLKIDLPFLVGAYVAGKYEMLNFNNIFNPLTNRNQNWDEDHKAFEFAFGYKLSPRTLWKISYRINDTDANPEPDDNIFGTQVSVEF